MRKSYVLLNVVAQPHPENAYRDLFEAASKSNPIKHRGERYARISPITASEDGIFRGRIATWSEIDPTAPAVSKSSLEEKSLEEAGIQFPDDIGFNSRIFYFSFREDKHALYVELNNDEGSTISPNVARKAFEDILRNAKGSICDDVFVHVASKSDALEYVLDVDSITKIDIDLFVPNPDDLSDEHREVLEEIEAMKIKRLQTTATKASGQDTLVLTPRMRIYTSLAKDNGQVEVSGFDTDEKRVTRSTKEVPAEIEIELEQDESSYGAIRRVAFEGRELYRFNGDNPDEFNVLE
ncbi:MULTISPECIES: DUF4747 family protein [unclassified Ruegeria]|uniref:DUF4747 family protein n=1 Tax=unclassified Ruegeria TaxID=2625375 RepID=UPI001489A903|nr:MULTISPECIES: DUF4747 family protein [unclassified Ruegeria]NOD77021.1 DUF4747 family protein [Ruegeria sp. HKCCD4332]NOD89491.1 DUF4747 family protein [Ruegeria sp. HKCCD4318]NOE13814.1 DUF4747 family protein [Ruegeria sp. HKCCD4318-2]NOG08251.1 DUF4747 family protein [Ruegeria sp. HKCCD4315]